MLGHVVIRSEQIEALCRDDGNVETRDDPNWLHALHSEPHTV